LVCPAPDMSLITMPLPAGLPEGGGKSGGVTPAATTTVLDAVTLPLALVAVSTYVVVAAGDTATEPLPETAPTTGVMLTPVAPPVAQDTVEDWPALMLAGLAKNVEIVGTPAGGAAPTVTVTDAVVVPVALLAVRTYVVVAAGEMLVEPLSPKFSPNGATLTDVAPLATQDNVEDWPAPMLAGLAVKEEITGTADSVREPTMTVTEAVVLPPPLVAVST
jgi:hypothetical protein